MNIRQADAHVRERRERDERLRKLDGKNASLEEEPQREHRGSTTKKDEPLAPAEPQMPGAGHEQTRRADENVIG